MRPSFEPAGHSATPIYDSLCAEYRRLFRAVPGDRRGEEELRFEAFGSRDFGRGLGRDFGVDSWRDRGREYGPGSGRRFVPSSLPALPPGRGDQSGQAL